MDGEKWESLREFIKAEEEDARNNYELTAERQIERILEYMNVLEKDFKY